MRTRISKAFILRRHTRLYVLGLAFSSLSLSIMLGNQTSADECGCGCQFSQTVTCSNCSDVRPCISIPGLGNGLLDKLDKFSGRCRANLAGIGCCQGSLICDGCSSSKCGGDCACDSFVDGPVSQYGESNDMGYAMSRSEHNHGAPTIANPKNFVSDSPVHQFEQRRSSNASELGPIPMPEPDVPNRAPSAPVRVPAPRPSASDPFRDDASYFPKHGSTLPPSVSRVEVHVLKRPVKKPVVDRVDAQSIAADGTNRSQTPDVVTAGLIQAKSDLEPVFVR